MGFDSPEDYHEAYVMWSRKLAIFMDITGLTAEDAKHYLLPHRRSDDAYMDLLWDIRCGKRKHVLPAKASKTAAKAQRNNDVSQQHWLPSPEPVLA